MKTRTKSADDGRSDFSQNSNSMFDSGRRDQNEGHRSICWTMVVNLLKMLKIKCTIHTCARGGGGCEPPTLVRNQKGRGRGLPSQGRGLIVRRGRKFIGGIEDWEQKRKEGKNDQITHFIKRITNFSTISPARHHLARKTKFL